jgi:ATP-dependent DNA ligase
MPPGTIFDGEVVTNDYGTVQEVTSILGSDPELSIYKQNTRGNLLFKVFDIPFHCGIDLRNGPLYERRQCLANIFDKYHYPFLSLSDIVPVNKRSYCDYVMKNGGEGVILKWRGAKYGEKKYWVKVKREETYDVFITGYQAADQYSKKVNGEISETKYYLNGWIGAVEIGMIDVITGNEVFVGTCSGFDESTRKYISCHKEECLGKVIEIKAQSQHKTGRFEHGRFEKWREDKHKSQCVLIPDIREG